MNKKRLILFLLVILTLIITPHSFAGEGEEHLKVKTVVMDVDNKIQSEVVVQRVVVKILEGKYKGKQLEFTHEVIKDSQYNMSLKKNMKIYLQLTLENNSLIRVRLVDISRSENISMLFFIFFLLLIIFGGMIGFRSFIALAITAFCIIKVFMPMILKGYSLITSTVLVCSIIIVASFILISGFTMKSFSAIVGTIGGTILSGGLAFYFGNLIQLSGISDDTIQMIVTHTQINIDYRGLLYSGITIGVLGAVMDVSMTITSVIGEIKKNNSEATIKSLFFSGLSVGRDIMATTTNTLILAYGGTSLPLLFLFALSDMSIVDIVNSQYIATEILRSLSGSIGLILTIPITSFIAAINS